MKLFNQRTVTISTVAAAVATVVAGYASGYSIMGAAPPVPTTAASTALAYGQAARTALPPKAGEQATFDRFIVKYRAGSVQARSASSVVGSLNSVAVRAGLLNANRTSLTVQHLRRTGVGADVVRASRSLDQAQAEQFMAALRADPNVEFVQPDYRKHRLDVTPNDPYYAAQWHYQHATAGINAPLAWDTSTGEGVVVAVLDTGYLDHQDLDANIIPGYDFIGDEETSGDGDGIRDPDAHDTGDWYGSEPSSFHGTHVAGTIAAVTHNAIGVAGVAYGAKVQPVRVLGHGGGWTSDIADAITWASGGHVDGVPDNATPADVLNLSLGGQGICSNDPMTQSAIDGAIGRGVTVVVAAGNDTSDASLFSPASCKGVITVGATGIDGRISWFSNYGPAVAIAAPGGNATSGNDPNERWIWSLGNSGTQSPDPSPSGDRYVGMIGTSMAAPHVAGIVALMQSAAVAAGNPALTPDQVRSVLRRTARPFTVAPPVNTPIGTGIADAAAAVAAARVPVTSEPATVLVNRQAATGLAGAAGEGLLFSLTVPAGVRALSLRSYGGTGDVSLYVSYEAQPNAALYDKGSKKSGNSEAISYTNPLPGTYYLRLVGEKAFSNVSVSATY